MKRMLFVLALLLLIAGCNSDLRNGLLSYGYEPNYVDGYVDGHSSGSSVGVGAVLYDFTRDQYRYENDKLYKLGWDDAYVITRSEMACFR